MEVFFGTPSYDKSVSVDYNRSVVEAAIVLSKLGIEMHHYVHAGDPFIDHARNIIVDAFLESGATDLVFVDADVGFDAKVLPRLLKYSQEIVGGLVPKRDTGNGACYHQNALTGIIEDGLFQAIELPTAFMRVKREAFEKIERPYFKLDSWRLERDVTDPTAPSGEDIYFCRNWIAAGQSLWVDSDISFSHRGSHAWRGNFYEHALSSGLLRQ